MRRAESESVSRGGIYLPEAVRPKSQEAVVVAVGRGRFLNGSDGEIAPEVAEGDRVLLARWDSAAEVKLDEVAYLVLDEREILAVIE